MSFKDLDIKLSYISCGDENIASAFLVPALKQAKKYQRSVGFFSSGVFGPIIDGVVGLSRNGGSIEIIASPRFTGTRSHYIKAMIIVFHPCIDCFFLVVA